MSQLTPTLPNDVAGKPDAAPTPPPARRRRRTSLAARGEPMVWLTGGAIACCVLMIASLLIFIAWQGLATFWPAPLARLELDDGKTLLGEPTREEVHIHQETHPIDAVIDAHPSIRHEVVGIDEAAGVKTVRHYTPRTLYRVGNYDLSGERFRWINAPDIRHAALPEWAVVVERIAWGNGYGILESITVDGQTIRDSAGAWEKFRQVHPLMRALIEEKRDLEQNLGGRISREQNEIRLRLRAAAARHGEESPQYRDLHAGFESKRRELNEDMARLRERVARLDTRLQSATVTIRTADGRFLPADRSDLEKPLLVAQVVRMYPANRLGFFDKPGIYLSRWWEYLSDEPREANTEGGVFPAIVGTVLLTFIMILFVVPIGVIAALYLREYARQGPLVSIVRISVNNLAGVPSIVYGVFGLGFFCYIVGGGIDQLLFSDRLPDPTVGKSALIWASLTLALLTLPVVIVATEEALAAVPRSMREGAYACGASKWQAIRRIVLPRAMPGIMTGTILAIARGAGEVAPLMLVGAVKLAPDLPINGQPPFFGTNLSFMHLGFHIYDLGFQSPDSEAARSMVYTTTLLLIAIVVALNFAAIAIRTRLRRAHSGGQF